MSPTDEGDETFSARLQHLYDRFYETNPLMTALWRSETNRLANSTNINQAPSTLLGIYHQDRRQSFLDQFVNDTLSIEQGGGRQAEQQTSPNFQDGSGKGCTDGNIRGHIDYEGLAELPETFTLSDRVIAHEYNFLRHRSTANWMVLRS
ncbi:unnamed protein product [Penicillium egyptiacum]|uniref:Uncharacterized protein n=1 Tax=Penicillium egyptiacum TaxID=1303716 RepID=A0A9W4KBU3_9EURO|nr:unnamed protein product [Penicillium egyptiacum]